MNDDRNELTAVAARAKRQFPDHTLHTPPFRVCLPVYELRLKVIEMAEHDLSTVARFILRLSNLDTMQPEDFSRLLGLSERYVAGAASPDTARVKRRLGLSTGYVAGAAVELLNANLVIQRPDRRIQITDQGRQALRDGGRSLRPRNRHPKVAYDFLTKRIIHVDIDDLLDREFVRKHGLFIVPTKPRRPRLSNLRIDEVREYDRAYGRRHDKTEILEIADIKDQRLKYRYDTIIVKLDPPSGDRPAFAVYRAQQYLEDESAEIQRLTDRGADLVPEELKAVPSKPWAASISSSSEESSILDAIDELDREVAQADQDSAEAKADQVATQNDQERVVLAARIEELESEKANLAHRLHEREDELRTVTRGEVRLIRTEEHHDLLLQAIEKSSSELTLVSAWISPYAFDDEVCRLLAASIGRGVNVRIAWGLGANRRGPEAARNRAKGNNALSKLRRLIPRGLKGNLMDKITDTHEKFIICDDFFCAWGSFNWLSYRGDLDAGYRRETSYYSERQSDIDLWKANAATLFGDG